MHCSWLSNQQVIICLFIYFSIGLILYNNNQSVKSVIEIIFSLNLCDKTMECRWYSENIRCNCNMKGCFFVLHFCKEKNRNYDIMTFAIKILVVITIRGFNIFYNITSIMCVWYPSYVIRKYPCVSPFLYLTSERHYLPKKGKIIIINQWKEFLVWVEDSTKISLRLLIYLCMYIKL